MNKQAQLYLWFDRDPEVFPPDHAIADVPGTADIDLLTASILEGQLGQLLPARIYMATHEKPENSRAVRSIDVGRLLRDLGLEHRRCYQVILPE